MCVCVCVCVRARAWVVNMFIPHLLPPPASVFVVAVAVADVLGAGSVASETTVGDPSGISGDFTLPD